MAHFHVGLQLEGRTWTNSCHYVMWFVLNATSGFIGKNMLTDFVPCLRLFDILFPDAEDPDKALELQLPGSRKRPDKRVAESTTEGDISNGRAEDRFTHTPGTDSTTFEVTGRLGDQDKLMSGGDDVGGVVGSTEEVFDQEADQDEYIDSTSAEESEDEFSLDILPPSPHRSTRGRKRQSRLMHLASAPVCLWQHVLRKSRQSHDHLPRVMPPALRPFETRISHRMRALIDSVSNLDSNGPMLSSTSQLTWKQLFVILNAYSTDTEVSPLIQRLVDMFWFAERDDSTASTCPYARLWPKLLNNGLVPLPYGLVARGRLQPLPHHLIRTIVLHLLLQKFAHLQQTDQLTTPAVAETMCRILACREVEPNNVNRILTLLPKLQPVWSAGEPDNPTTQSSAQSTESNANSTSAVNSGSALATCNVLATLLDIIGHRLADTLLPEVRLQTLISLVNLLRVWSAWSAISVVQTSTDDGNLGRDGKFARSPFEVPMELFYNLEWIICKLSRSIQAPDCVIYGLCLAISPALLAQASQSASSFLGGGAALGTGSVLGATGTGPQSVQCAPRNVSGAAARSAAAAGGTHQSCTNPMGSDMGSAGVAMADMSGATGTGVPGGGTVPGYPFLMTDNLELNRFILFSLLQVYYVYAEAESELTAHLHSSPLQKVLFITVTLSLSPFPRNFVLCLITEPTLLPCEYSGIDLLSLSKLSDLKYADDIVLISEDPGKLQAFLDSLSASVAMFECAAAVRPVLLNVAQRIS
ncbi:unnamed protein product [Echinostoma caproni]|uniref:Mediator of RNA polymerase II transcription subunit 23 n=1 Tax=Echinostoma caproni TaxID=27848 RepID=A0A183ATK0_9TREM|nr:unnamed protein product [Echinostoma caproni]